MNELIKKTKYIDVIGKIVIQTKNGFSYYIDSLHLSKGTDKLDNKIISLVRVLKKQKDTSIEGSQDLLEANTEGWEVWILKEPYENEKKLNKWKIKFPSNEDFGSYGWSYKTEKAALNKLKELTI